MKKRRIVSIALLALLTLVVLLPTAAVMLLASTERGLQFVVSRLDQRLLPGRTRLTLREARGSLVGGFTLKHLGVDNPWVHLEFDDVEGRAELLPILWQSIEAPRLHARRALVQVLSPQRRPGPDTTPRVRFMPGALSVRVERLTVDEGSLLLASGTRYDATAVDLATIVRSREIRVLRGGMELPYVRVQTSGRLRAGWPLGLNGQARLNIHAEGQPDWIINGEFDGDLDELPLHAGIAAPFRADVQGRATDLTRGWRFNGAAVVDDFDLRAWGGGGALGLIRGTLKLTGDRDGYTAKGQLEPTGLAAGPFDVDFRGGYADRRVALDRVLLDHRPSGGHADLHGAVYVESAGPRLDLAGDWTRFRWPLTGTDVAAQSPRGSFTLAGSKPWALSAQGELLVAELPPLPVELRGTLYTDRLAVETADVQAWGGRAALRGEARWSPQERWSIGGRIEDLDFSRLRPDLPGRLASSFHAQGRGFGATGEIDLVVDGISGRLRGLAAGGAGTVERRGGPEARRWNFRDVALHLGGSKLQLEGTTGTPRDLRFELNSQDLSLVSPTLRGRVHARGNFSGTDAEPSLRLQLEGHDFERGADSLQRLDADLDVQLSPGGRTRGTAHARTLLWAGRRVDDIKLDLSGTASASVLGVNLAAQPLSVGLRARGAFADGRWRGVVDVLDARDGDTLDLHLVEFAPLNLATDGVSLGRACLAGGDTNLCLQASQTASQWHANVEAQKLPLRALTAGLSRDTRYEGRVELGFDARGGGGRLPEARLEATLSDALLRHREASGREERVNLGSGRIDGSLRGEGFSLSLGLNAGDSGRLVGRLEGQRSETDWPQWPVRGQLEVETDALGIADLFVMDVDRLAGRLAAKFDVAGTLGEPRLGGTLQVRGGEVDVYRVNLALRDLEFDARLEDRALQLDGHLRAGEGNAQVQGRIAWQGGEPAGELHVRGERLRLVDVPEARVEASPDLRFRVDGRRIEVTGEVTVPEARFEPADITNAVLPSGDEVLVGAPPADPGRQFQVTSNIRLTLGEKVSIDTYGLSGRLTGSLVTRSGAGEISRATGELSIAEGRYAAFGRNLDIERGRLLFNNGPVADPGVDLRAQKVFPDITAGVNVRGTLRAPRMTFFSVPAIPQSQIVSVLLAGGSLQSVQSDRRGSARNDLLAQGGAILAQQFGNRVGIEDVSLESDLANETSLVLGRYLTPGLYVSYGISLAEAINIVKLRYTIGDHWTLKTEAGRARSADIVYTIRKK